MEEAGDELPVKKMRTHEDDQKRGAEEGAFEKNPGGVCKELPVQHMKKLLVDPFVSLEALKKACVDLLSSYDKLSGEASELRGSLQRQTKQDQMNLEIQVDAYEKLLKKQYADHLKESDELISRCAVLTDDKENYKKLTTIIFSRWVLKLFLKRILMRVDPRLVKEQNIQSVERAWRKFFVGSSRIKVVKEAYEEITYGIPIQNDISLEVDRIRKAEGDESINSCDWFAQRGTKLYFKFNDIVHNLKRLDWVGNEEALKLVLAFIPKVPSFDTALISVVHDAVLPFMKSDSSS